MKRKLFLLLLLIANVCLSQTIDVIDFKVNEPVGRDFSAGERFDFEFKIRGDYSYRTNGFHQIDLIVYKDAVHHSNEIARSYWNREDDVNLIFNQYTKKDWWNTSLINYATTSSKKFILVVKYGNATKQLNYFIPVLDSDNDGVPDEQDNCPNEAGPSSNNGCPIPQGKPDLTLEDFIIIDDQGNQTGPNQQYAPSLKDNTSFDVIVKIKNIGNVRADNVQYYMLASTSSNNYPTPDIYGSPIQEFISNQNIGSVNSGNIKTHQLNTDLSRVSYLLNQDQANYFYIDIDQNNRIDEERENNNIYVILFYYLGAGNKNSLKNYTITIFDMNGNKIKDAKIINKEQEQEVINNLPKGLYIINDTSNGKSKKIFKKE